MGERFEETLLTCCSDFAAVQKSMAPAVSGSSLHGGGAFPSRCAASARVLQRGKPCPSALRSSFHVEMSCACVPAIQDFGKKCNHVSMRRQEGARQNVSPHVPVPASGDAQHLPEEGVDEGGRHPPWYKVQGYMAA